MLAEFHLILIGSNGFGMKRFVNSLVIASVTELMTSSHVTYATNKKFRLVSVPFFSLSLIQNSNVTHTKVS